MPEFLLDFWLSSLPLILAGLLAGLVVVTWDWRISLPGIFFIQLLAGQVAMQRGVMPGWWATVFACIVLSCLVILFLSILQSNRDLPPGRIGTLIFRLLLLGFAILFLSSTPVAEVLPLLDEQLTRFVLWLGICALFGIATGEGALTSAFALLLWLIGAEVALIAIAPAAVVVVLLGGIFLLVSLACSYLIVAENLSLAEDNRPLTDAVFPAAVPPQPSLGTQATRFLHRLTGSSETSQEVHRP
ncbi:MAG: hypothetical protein KF753_16430 [Caldilineaceae bacterium]|nr:hypothetical protein [Caldilineaceae bacterium]